MARSRTVSPKFFKNEHLAELPYEARLLFIGLWTLADRSGRLEDRPKRIQVELFPYGLNGDIDQLLESLDAGDFIFRYRFNQEMFIQIPKWFSYQRPHPHEVDSVIPPIPCDLSDFKGCRDMSRASRDMSLHVMTCQSVPSVPSVPSGSSGSSVPPKAPRAKPARECGWLETAFTEFWSVVWAKIGRGASWAEYRLKATTPELAEQINSAAKEQGPRLLLEAARREGGVPLHPRTWLHQERYLDERQQTLIPGATRQLDPWERKQAETDRQFSELLEAELEKEHHA